LSLEIAIRGRRLLDLFQRGGALRLQYPGMQTNSPALQNIPRVIPGRPA